MVFSALYLAVPGCTQLYLAVPGAAKVCHDLPYHRLPLTGLNASVYTYRLKMLKSYKWIGLGWMNGNLHKHRSAMLIIYKEKCAIVELVTQI